MKKKIIILGFTMIMGIVLAQDIIKEPSEDMLKIYNSLVNYNWNGFDGKGTNIPDAKLMWRGFVDFPYYDSKKKNISKKVEIYKYDPPLNMNYFIPSKYFDYYTTPEIAWLSLRSDCKNRSRKDWEELLEYVKNNPKPRYLLYYKIVIKEKDSSEIAVFFDTGDWPLIMSKSKEGAKWEFVKTISSEDNLLFSVVSDCLEVSELTGSHEERLSKKIKEIMENKIVLIGDYPEEPKQEKRKPRPIPAEIEPKEIEPQGGGKGVVLEDRCGGESQPPDKIIMLSPSE